ncbi:MAG: TPM domain-containing protein, partial [Paludibacter sp.]|nr:TPM domain-containing protein [Paludibacter sp.]
MRKTFALLLVWLVVFTGSAQYTVETIPNPKTANAANFVANPDNIINPQTVSQINQLLNELQATNKSEVAVVLVNSIGYEEIKPFATRLFKQWGIGTAENSNGLLVLFVMDQRKVTFETGYGLEGVLPDAITKRIQTRFMTPEFKNGNYDAGMLAGTEQIVKTVKGEVFVEKKVEIPWAEILPMAVGVYLVLMLLSFVWVAGIVSKIRKNTKLSSNIVRYKAIKT